MKKYNFNHERHEKHENKTEIFVSVYLRRTQKHADLFFTFPLSCVFVLFVVKRLFPFPIDSFPHSQNRDFRVPLNSLKHRDTETQRKIQFRVFGIMLCRTGFVILPMRPA